MTGFILNKLSHGIPDTEPDIHPSFGRNMQNRYLILNMLSDGKFHSGEDIGNDLGLSRTAVWKHLNALSDMGLELHKVRGRGYRLAAPIELLDESIIRRMMDIDSNQIINNLEIYAELESTNHYLKQKIQQGADTGHVCMSESQSEGRGTKGRTWVSPFGRNIYLSLLWKFNCSPSELCGLSLSVGVAVARAIEEIGAADVKLKWPNDLVWKNQKLGGLLLEMAGEASGPCQVVIGVGVNVSMPESVGRSIDQPWVDINTILSNEPVSRNKLTGSILKHLCGVLSEFQDAGFAVTRKEWLRRDVIVGKAVKLLLPNREIFGVVKDIDENGALLLESEGRVKQYASGEVSLRLQS